MIDWPGGIERTPPNDRRRNNSFEVSLATAGSDLETQMDRLDPDEWRAETGSGGSHVFGNGLPKASANPDDPGVVVRWTDGGSDYAVCCDRWTRLRDNLRSVGLWIKETRMRDQRPVSTARDSFAAARLPRPLRWSNWGAHRPAPPVCDKPPTGPVGSGRADRIPSTRTHQRDPLLLPSSRSPRPPPVCRSAGSLRSPPAPFSQLTVARSVCSSKLTVDRPAVAQQLRRRARKGEARKPGVHSGSTGVGRWHGRLRSCPGLPPGRRFIRERRLCSYHTRRRGRRMNPTKPPTVNRAHM